MAETSGNRKELLKIITNEEARANEAESASQRAEKLWVFKGDNVLGILRLLPSRKFTSGDARSLNAGNSNGDVLYPNEGNPLWEKK